MKGQTVKITTQRTNIPNDPVKHCLAKGEKVEIIHVNPGGTYLVEDSEGFHDTIEDKDFEKVGK